MNLLIPEKNNNFLKFYHRSSKTMIPLILSSYISNQYTPKLEKVFHTLNVLNLGYHSYVSTSCIITDYIKHQKISKLLRVTNLNLHVLSSLGALVFIKNINYEKITKTIKE